VAKRLLLCALAVLVVGGAPASCKHEPTHRRFYYNQLCTGEDLEETLEYCAPKSHTSRCADAPEEFSRPCSDGCLMHMCRVNFACTTPGDRWCGTSCADTHAAVFWRDARVAENRCDNLGQETAYAPGPYTECVIKESEKICPELAGTSWFAPFARLAAGRVGQTGR
jgi:hypothetical protein